MISFFIADINLVGKQKIQEIVKLKRFDNLILRNRGVSTETTLPIKPYKPYITSKFSPFLRTFHKGRHISLFHDKLISKIGAIGADRTASAHNLPQIFEVRRKFKPNLTLISPIFPTQTHPFTKPMGLLKMFNMINIARGKNFILMGGVNPEKYKKIKKLDFHNRIKGFAAIRAFF